MNDADKRTESDRGDRGRFLPGHGIKSPGKPSYPDWFKGKLTEEAMDFLAKIVRGEAEDPRVSRAQACIEVLDRVMGKPKPLAEDNDSREAFWAEMLERMRQGGKP